MSSSRKKQLELTVALLGEYWGEKLLCKLEKEISGIRKRSDATIRECIYRIVNYLDNVEQSDYSILSSHSIEELEIKWNNWFSKYKEKYTNENYIEQNKVLFNYEDGFYWVLGNTFYSAEMIIRMDNCGRVPIDSSYLELREIRENKNYTHVVVVLDKEGTVTQIQGSKNEKPNKEYSKYICELLINYLEIKKVKSIYPDENDFKFKDLTTEEFIRLKKCRPDLLPLL